MKVLFLTVTIGAGHNVVANNLKNKFVENGCTAETIDIFANNKRINEMISGYGVKLMYMFPKVANYVYYKDKEKDKCFYDNLVLKVKDEILEKINKFEPDVIISSHIAGQIITHDYRNKIHKPFINYFIVTDYDLPPSIRKTEKDCFVVVPTEDIKNELIDRGFENNSILPFGIPIDEKYYKQLNKKELITKLDLQNFDENKVTILFMGGGKGLGNVYNVIKKVKDNENLQIIAICGKNETLKQSIEKLKVKAKAKIYNYGFSKNVDEFLEVSDYLFGKAGGLSATEAVTKNIKIISFKNMPCPELSNLLYLNKTGHAIIINSVKELTEIISEKGNKNNTNKLANFSAQKLFDFHKKKYQHQQ